MNERGVTTTELEELGKLFHRLGRWNEFEEAAHVVQSPEVIRSIREQVGAKPRRRVLSPDVKF